MSGSRSASARGEHLLWQAQHHPDVGIDRRRTLRSRRGEAVCRNSSLFRPSARGEGEAVSAPAESDVVRSIPSPPSSHSEGDARDYYRSAARACLGRVFLLFPDPWPKKRHHKRRFIQMDMLDALARVMKPAPNFALQATMPAMSNGLSNVARARLIRVDGRTAAGLASRAPRTGRRPATNKRHSTVFPYFCAFGAARDVAGSCKWTGRSVDRRPSPTTEKLLCGSRKTAAGDGFCLCRRPGFL